MTGLGQTMFDAVLVTHAIKNVSTEPIGRAVAIAWLLSERHTVVSQVGVDLVWKGLHDLAWKLSGIALGRRVEKRNVGELRYAINCHEQVLLAALKT